MTVGDFLQQSTLRLTKAGISTARLDSLILLEDESGQDRANILAHPEQELSKSTEVKLNNKIEQRRKHLPLAYIRGKVNFYGRQFLVNRHVLTPRPETEAIITLALETLKVRGSRFEVRDKKTRVVDIGTGSGAIAITIKLERPELNVIATDASEEAIKMARKNANKLGADIHFCRGDLLTPTSNLKPQTFNLLLANLPYVPDRYYINEAASFEPEQAIFAGDDGLDVYRRFWQQIAELNHKPEHVVTESLPDQHSNMAALAEKSGYRLQKTKDFAQQFTLA